MYSMEIVWWLYYTSPFVRSPKTYFNEVLLQTWLWPREQVTIWVQISEFANFFSSIWGGDTVPMFKRIFHWYDNTASRGFVQWLHLKPCPGVFAQEQFGLSKQTFPSQFWITAVFIYRHTAASAHRTRRFVSASLLEIIIKNSTTASSEIRSAGPAPQRAIATRGIYRLYLQSNFAAEKTLSTLVHCSRCFRKLKGLRTDWFFTLGALYTQEIYKAT